ncbi:hypothetical protein [Xylophilus sp. GOD-11R]|uniref:hypothetical protein n=1 Tax=Xylophilus sp. GOD-11R TaxID=3089814 RepID=UPI00298CC993|nr:hypothetical protein [Xylophilus sp. GOD-11R]WPB58107.1 hypothetical protein R9X41_05560 [Xylophilus sp. GOD-11R]
MANQKQQDNKNHDPQGNNQHNAGNAGVNQSQQEQRGTAAGQQRAGTGVQGGTHEQHVKAGQQSHKNTR